MLWISPKFYRRILARCATAWFSLDSVCTSFIYHQSRLKQLELRTPVLNQALVLQDGEAEQDQFANWLGDASDDDAGDSKPADGGCGAEQRDEPRLAFNGGSTDGKEENAEKAVGTAAERRPLFG